MNFFVKETAISDLQNVGEMAVVASRIYLVLLGASITVLVLFSGLADTTFSVTVPFPTLAVYEKLHADYPQTLSCPCKQIALPYKTFISLTVSYHQVMN